MGKVRTVCAYFELNARWSRLFYPTISQRSCHVQHGTYIQCISILLYVPYTIISSFYINAILYCKKEYFTWEKCVEFALTLHWIGVETRLFYPTISQRSCHIQHCTYIQYIAIQQYFQYTGISSSFFFGTFFCK